MENGELLGAELFAYGPLFTAEGGHGTEYLNYDARERPRQARDQFLRIPKSPADAGAIVHQLKLDGVDGIKAILQGDFGNIHFVRLDRPIYEAVARAAHAENLPLATHTNTPRDVEDAIAAHSDSIEHGALTDRAAARRPRGDAAAGLAYDPTLSVVAVYRDMAAGSTAMLDSPLVQQIVPADKMAEARQAMPPSPTEGPSGRTRNIPANAAAQPAWARGRQGVDG